MYKVLDDFAKELIGEINNLDETLYKKKNDLEIELAQVNNELVEISKKKARSRSYTSECCFCPRRFIFEGMTIEMIAIPSDGENDILKCSHCGILVEITD